MEPAYRVRSTCIYYNYEQGKHSERGDTNYIISKQDDMIPELGTKADLQKYDI